MSDQQLDYHVGLLRGFMLAQNAPPPILHALDVLLTGYRSKAGAVIGSQPDIATFTRDLGVETIPEKKETVVSDADDKKSDSERVWAKWSAEEIDTVKQSIECGMSVSEIVKLLPGRKYATVYAKMVSLGFSAPKKEFGNG